MAHPELINQQPITMAELKAKLAEIKERDKELSERSAKTEEYLNQFVEIQEKAAVELKRKLEALKIMRLKPEMITKIVDFTPATAEELKLILQDAALTQEDVRKIIEVVAEHLPAKK